MTTTASPTSPTVTPIPTVAKPLALLQFETATTCHGGCTFCMHRHMTRTGTMSLSHIADLAYHLAWTADELIPVGMQEPLLDPRLPQTLSNLKCYAPRTPTTIYSTMSDYPDAAWRRIVQWGVLDNLTVSYYGGTEALHRTLQPGVDYQQARRNIRRLLALRRRRGWLKPRVTMEYLATPETWPHAKRFLREWKHRVDHVGIVRLDSWGGNIPVDPAFNERTFGPPRPRVPCPRLYRVQNIHYDGTISMCCLDYNDDYALGNVFTDGWYAFWKSPKRQELIQLHEAGRWSEIPLCRRCDAWQHYPIGPEWMTYWLTNKKFVSSVSSPCTS